MGDQGGESAPYHSAIAIKNPKSLRAWPKPRPPLNNVRGKQKKVKAVLKSVNVEFAP